MKSQTTNFSRPGANHTGVSLHPELAAEMIEGTTEFGPTSSGGADLLAQNRIRVAQVSEPAATMPPSRGIAVELLPLLDKLGARLQFERMGVRLYQALISKLDAYGTFEGGPARGDLEHIRDEEHRHMLLCQQMITSLGGDPTAVTPCANLQATASRGIGDVLVDPRTNLVECLDAILVAELADVASWDLLAKTAVLAGQQQLEDVLRAAEQVETDHLLNIRSWIEAASRLASSAAD